MKRSRWEKKAEVRGKSDRTWRVPEENGDQKEKEKNNDLKAQKFQKKKDLQNQRRHVCNEKKDQTAKIVHR